jgi:hypothetical protein
MGDSEDPDAPPAGVRPMPWLARLAGALFLLAGASILVFFFPTHVRLRCDRQQDVCTLEQSNLLERRSRSWRVGELTGARLESVDDEDGTSFRVWVETRSGSLPFTPYSIGLSRRHKEAIVRSISAYVRDTQTPTLDVSQDARTPLYSVAAGLMLLGLLALLFPARSAPRLR